MYRLHLTINNQKALFPAPNLDINNHLSFGNNIKRVKKPTTEPMDDYDRYLSEGLLQFGR